MHSNIGYICTLALNLSLLLPLANNPKVDNYVIVLCVLSFSKSFSLLRTRTELVPLPPIERTYTGSFLASGGVSFPHYFYDVQKGPQI